MTPAKTVSVERLALHVPAMSEEDARRLAERVAQELRRWPQAPAGRIASVTARVDAGSARPEALAAQIAEAVAAAALRELA